MDSGDLFFKTAIIEDYLRMTRTAYAEFMVEQFNQIGCDAIGIGETDFALGVDFLKRLEKKSNFLFLNANIVDSSGKNVFTPYVIKKIKGIKIGIFSVLHSSYPLPEGLRALDIQETTRKLLPEISSKADFILALTHQGHDNDISFAEEFNEIDWVMGAHDGSALHEPQRIKNTLIFQASTEGKYVGRLDLSLKKGASSHYTHHLIALDEQTFGPGDPKVYQKVQAFKETIAKLYVKEEKATYFEAGQKTKAGNTVEYATYRKCMECHKAQYNVWKNSKHASAIIPLYVRNQHLNPECIVCHSVGFQKPGGFSNSAHPFHVSQQTKKSLEEFLERLIRKEKKALPLHLQEAIKKDKKIAQIFKEKKYKGSMIELREHPEFDKWIRSEYIKAIEKEKWRKDFMGVQCENCHSSKGLKNPQGQWIPHFTESNIFPKKVVVQTCLQCHNTHQSPHFDIAKDRRVMGEKDAKFPFHCKLGVF